MIAPPLAASNTCAPSLRSISSTSNAAASTGKAVSTMMEVTSTFQGEDRHPEHGHARGAHADDRGDEVHPGPFS